MKRAIVVVGGNDPNFNVVHVATRIIVSCRDKITIFNEDSVLDQLLAKSLKLSHKIV